MMRLLLKLFGADKARTRKGEESDHLEGPEGVVCEDHDPDLDDARNRADEAERRLQMLKVEREILLGPRTRSHH